MFLRDKHGLLSPSSSLLLHSFSPNKKDCLLVKLDSEAP